MTEAVNARFERVMLVIALVAWPILASMQIDGEVAMWVIAGLIEMGIAATLGWHRNRA